MKQFTNRFKGPVIFFSLMIWVIGMSYLATGQRVYLAVLVPIGTISLYYAVFIMFFARGKEEIDERQKRRAERYDQMNTFETLSHYSFSIKIWIFSLVILIYMPFSNYHTYQRVVEHLEWNKTQQGLNTLYELDREYGESREYSYPEWVKEDSTTRIAKVHTQGALAYGSFIYALDDQGQILYVDSIFVQKE